VPCEQSTARSLLDAALERWISASILPLAQDLGEELRRLADTRYAGVLAQAATAAALPPGRALELATALPPERRAPLLEPLLSLPGEHGDRAAALLLPSAPAQARLASRLGELEGPHGVRMAAALEPWQGDVGLAALVRLARDGDGETSELALRALSQAGSSGAVAALERVLDLDLLYLRPVVERLAHEPGSAARARAWLSPDAPQAPAALELLRQADRLADPEVAELVGRLDPHLRLQALSGDEQKQARVEQARKEFADPASAARVWAASVLMHERSHADEALELLYELADSSDPDEQIAALYALVEVDSQRAAEGAGEILATDIDTETRRELVFLLIETVGYGGDEVMARLLGDPDDWTAFTAASELLRVGDRRAVQPLLAMARGDGSFAELALRALLREPSQLRTHIRRLLSLKRIANRRLGARLLMAGADAALLVAAEGLLDDPDATVRAAAAYALAFGAEARRPEALAYRVRAMLADTKPIEGPDLVASDSLRSPAEPKRARCMADVAYRLVAEQPGLAEAPE
jgi:HEAT repeat protein